MSAFEDEMEVVWIGDWLPSLDGRFETRARVAQSGEGFHPGYEVSHRGGDCDPSYTSAKPTLEQAKNEAARLCMDC